MRIYIISLCFLLLAPATQAQQQQSDPLVATSAWTYVRIKPAAITQFFSDDLKTNRNQWQVGQKVGYIYEFTQTGYRFRRQSRDVKRPAFSFIKLPDTINLNKVDSFTVEVKIMTNPGIIPAGGLLFGVKDSLNYCHFQLNANRQISIKSVVNGVSFANYMRGDFIPTSVPINTQQNILKITKKEGELHFYINDKEIDSSPYSFRPFKGNGIGFTTPGWLVTFQNLLVTTTGTP